MPQSEFHLGGQAVLEGVMMRSPHYYAVAVRRMNGSIHVEDEPLRPLQKRKWWLRFPPLRGFVALLDTVALGIKVTRISADIYLHDATGGRSRSSNVGFAFQVAVSLALAIGLFIVLPHLITDLAQAGNEVAARSVSLDIVRDPHTALGRVCANLVEGLLRLFFFAGFLTAIGFIPDIRRLFAYHGAEHKVVHAVENGRALTVQEVEPFPTAHPRCGTAFVFVVLVFSIVVFAFIPWGDWPLRIGARLLLLPIVAGVSYELIRLAALSPKGVALKPLVVPGLWLQQLTARQPTPDQLEVAIAAMERVLKLERERGSYSEGVNSPVY